MKQVLIFLLSFFLVFNSFSQHWTPRSSSSITAVDQRLKANLNFYLPWARDTTLSGGLDSLGALLMVVKTGDTSLYMRIPRPGGNKWIKLLKSGDAGTGVTSFNTRVGAVTLLAADIITALGYTPVNGNGTNLQYIAGNGSKITFPAIPAQFNPIGGANMTITGVYPNLTFSASGGGGSGGIVTLNGLTASAQAFATGFSGTDFNIVSSGVTHTFNFPTVSGTNRGLVTPSLFNIWNAKQSAISLTTTGSSGPATFAGNNLNIPNYGNALTGNTSVGGQIRLAINGTYNIKSVLADLGTYIIIDSSLSGQVRWKLDTAGLVNYFRTHHPFVLKVPSDSGLDVSATGDTLFFRYLESYLVSQDSIGGGNLYSKIHNNWVLVGSVGGGGGSTLVYNTVSEMLAVRPANATGAVCLGNVAAGDCQPFRFTYNSSSSATSNGMTILTPTTGSGAGRYLISPLYGNVSLKQMGVFPSSDNTAQLIAANAVAAGIFNLIIDRNSTYIVDPTFGGWALIDHSHIYGEDSATSIIKSKAYSTQNRFVIGYKGSTDTINDVVIENLTVDGNTLFLNDSLAPSSPVTDTLSRIVHFQQAKNIYLNKLIIKNGGNYSAFYSYRATNLTLKNSRIDSAGSTAIADDYDSLSVHLYFENLKLNHFGTRDHYDAVYGTQRNGESAIACGAQDVHFTNIDITNGNKKRWGFAMECQHSGPAYYKNIYTHGEGVLFGGATIGGSTFTNKSVELYVDGWYQDSSFYTAFAHRDSVNGGRKAFNTNYFEMSFVKNGYFINSTWKNAQVSTANVFANFNFENITANNQQMNTTYTPGSGNLWSIALHTLGPTVDSTYNVKVKNSTFLVKDGTFAKFNYHASKSNTVMFEGNTVIYSGSMLIGEIYPTTLGVMPTSSGFNNNTFVGTLGNKAFVTEDTTGGHSFIFTNNYVNQTNIDTASNFQGSLFVGLPMNFDKDRTTFTTGTFSNYINGVSHNLGLITVAKNGGAVSANFHIPNTFNVLDYMPAGYVPGTSNAIPGFQAAIQAARNNHGGVVSVPVGTYIFKDTLTTLVNGYDVNCQVYFPLDTADQDRCHITIRGESNPNYTVYGANSTTLFPTSGVVIKSMYTGTRSTTVQGTAIFGGNGPDFGGVGNGENLNYITVENITFVAKNNPNGHGPEIGGVQGRHMASMQIHNCVYLVDTTGNETHLPERNISGFETSDCNNETQNEVLRSASYGIKWGIVLGEHTSADQISAWLCYTGIAGKVGNHASNINRALVVSCKNSLGYYKNGSGCNVTDVAPLNIELLDIEFDTASTGKWFKSIYCINDSLNALTGNVKYWVNVSFHGGDGNIWTTQGATNMIQQKLGTGGSGGGISGLTAGLVPVATSATTIGNGSIHDNGTTIGIGTAPNNNAIQIKLSDATGGSGPFPAINVANTNATPASGSDYNFGLITAVSGNGTQTTQFFSETGPGATAPFSGGTGGYIGTRSNDPFNIFTNSTIEASLSNTGVFRLYGASYQSGAEISADTAYKVLVQATDGTLKRMFWPALGGGGGSQTPWTSDINGAGHTLYGNNTSAGTLTLGSTSHATKGIINFGAAGGTQYDETKNTWGIGTAPGNPGILIKLSDATGGGGPFASVNISNTNATPASGADYNFAPFTAGAENGNVLGQFFANSGTGASAPFSTGSGIFVGSRTNHPLYFYTNSVTVGSFAASGQLKLNNYGSGTFTGTAAYGLAVDASHNIIEVTPSSYTFNNGLTNSSGTVGIGGQLLGNTHVGGSTGSYGIDFGSISDGLSYFKTYSSIGIINGTALSIGAQVSFTGGLAPSIAAGAGAGTSPGTPTVVGQANGMKVTVITGTAPSTSSVVATVTYVNAYPNGTTVILYPGNAATAALNGTSMVYTSGGTGSFTINSGTLGLTGSTTYLWNAVVFGY